MTKLAQEREEKRRGQLIVHMKKVDTNSDILYIPLVIEFRSYIR